MKRTTVRIDDDLLRRARKLAAEEGRTLTALIEEGLKWVTMKRRRGVPRSIELPVSRAAGGALPGVDINRSAELEEVMSGR
jgi:Ribbon-helix-helix protein, copG family